MTPAPKPKRVLPPTDTAAAQAQADAAEQARQRSAKGYQGTNLRAGSLLQQYAQQLTKLQTGAA